MIAERQKDRGWGESVVESFARDKRLFGAEPLVYAAVLYSYSGNSKL
jgi:hypothetical protein